MSEDENGESSNLGLFGTAFAALIGLVLIIAEARSGQSPFGAGPILVYGVGAVFVVAPTTRYYFQLKGIDINIGRRIGIDHLKGSNAIGSIEMKDGHFHLHQEVNTEPDESDYDEFDFSQDFGLLETGDFRAFPFELEEGESVVGHVSAKDDVSAYVATRRAYSAFEEGEGLRWVWDAGKGTYLQIAFPVERSGTYFLFVTNRENLQDFDERVPFRFSKKPQGKVPVQVRLDFEEGDN